VRLSAHNRDRIRSSIFGPVLKYVAPRKEHLKPGASASFNQPSWDVLPAREVLVSQNDGDEHEIYSTE